ncbi:MAG: THxN family PEP-CTERM protein [Halieaceae bacterium]|jgi:hypothetical protein|nr:THxN family PEP-CTERM protein [Halieaceae bacterium]
MLRRKIVSTLGGSCLLAATAALQVPAAHAIPIVVTGISGTWTAANTSPAGGVTGLGTSTISWGIPFDQPEPEQQSSYVFVADAVPTAELDPESPFGLGTFTHNNFQIQRPFLDNAELTVTLTLDILDGPGGIVLATEVINSVFDFTHLETPNNNNPIDPTEICPDGNFNGTPPNTNGCADRVTFETSALTETFEVGDERYFFELVGFCSTCPSEGEEPSIVSEFWTVENDVNDAVLVAQYRVVVEELPAPGAAWLLVSGLAALGASRGRRRTLRS